MSGRLGKRGATAAYLFEGGESVADVYERFENWEFFLRGVSPGWLCERLTCGTGTIVVDIGSSVMVQRMPFANKAKVLSKGRTSDSRLGKCPACLSAIPRAPMTTLPHPQTPKCRRCSRGSLPGPSGWRGGRTLSLARSLTALPRIATCFLPSFLPSSIFHPHPSPTLADSTTLNPVSTLPSSLPLSLPRHPSNLCRQTLHTSPNHNTPFPTFLYSSPCILPAPPLSTPFPSRPPCPLPLAIKNS